MAAQSVGNMILSPADMTTGTPRYGVGLVALQRCHAVEIALRSKVLVDARKHGRMQCYMMDVGIECP
eukprot:13514198-Alexandrium_andersonii.AAC.1